MESVTDTGEGVKTTGTVFAILETLQEQDGARISDVADELGLANSTAYRHLSTLADREYVLKEEGEYYLSMRFLRFGHYVRERKKSYQLAGPKVEELAAKTDERAEFMVEEHGRSVFVHREVGDNAVRTDSGIGKNHPLHATAAGKAILAFLPEDRIEAILERRGLEAYTDYTITDRETLFEELESVRNRGVSFNKQEYIEGLRAVGVPVLAPDESVIGALSVSGPTHRLKGTRFEEQIPDLLLGTANEIELKIPYS
jgi:DNA-binding IclR family transcriptional regulator